MCRRGLLLSPILCCGQAGCQSDVKENRRIGLLHAHRIWCYIGVMSRLFRVVLDTNVLFEGLTKRNSVSGVIVDAWFEGLIQVCVSNALIYESFDVLSRKLSPARHEQAIRALAGLLAYARSSIGRPTRAAIVVSATSAAPSRSAGKSAAAFAVRRQPPQAANMPTLVGEILW